MHNLTGKLTDRGKLSFGETNEALTTSYRTYFEPKPVPETGMALNPNKGKTNFSMGQNFLPPTSEI